MSGLTMNQKQTGKAILTHSEYGKSRVRISKLVRNASASEFHQYSVDISLQGNFDDCFLKGDNSKVIATDSMKNTVYALASENDIANVEGFAALLAKHFIKTYAQVTHAVVQVTEDLWDRMAQDEQEDPYCYVARSHEKRSAGVLATADGISVDSGIEGLQVLKTKNSGFAGFVRDQFTTLAETTDRLLATTISAHWTYNREPSDYNTCYSKVRKAIIDTFMSHNSLAVQETIYAMGTAALEAANEVEEITFTLPNQHHLPFNLEPLGRKNNNQIFVPTDEPYGSITGSIHRR